METIGCVTFWLTLAIIVVSIVYGIADGCDFKIREFFRRLGILCAGLAIWAVIIFLVVCIYRYLGTIL
jgi:hypothetical protein